ncbi:MAG: hypothetical protein ACR2HV_10790 [Acidimicrobiales bacterium]
MVTIPLQSVAYREGAEPRPDMVSVLDADAVKENAKPPGPTGDAAGLELETRLKVQAWVRNIDPAKHSWLDLHVFDENNQLIRGETLALEYLKAAGDEGDVYAFDGSVHRGTGAVGGSVWFGPDVRKVQYRLYYEVNGTVFSDGLLCQHELAADSDVINPPVGPSKPRRAKPATAKAEKAPTAEAAATETPSDRAPAKARAAKAAPKVVKTAAQALADKAKKK